jgi:hypothetical protein
MNTLEIFGGRYVNLSLHFNASQNMNLWEYCVDDRVIIIMAILISCVRTLIATIGGNVHGLDTPSMAKRSQYPYALECGSLLLETE